MILITLNPIKIDCADIELLDSGIILLRYKYNYNVELKDVKEVEKSFLKLLGNQKIYCLMDTSKRLFNVSEEAQKYLSKEASIVKNKQLKASALVIDSLPNRLLARFFSKFHQPSFQMKIFSKHSEALKWLMMVKNEKL